MSDERQCACGTLGRHRLLEEIQRAARELVNLPIGQQIGARAMLLTDILRERIVALDRYEEERKQAREAGAPKPSPEPMVRCHACLPEPGEVNHPAGMIFVGWGLGWQRCNVCGGSTLVRKGTQ